MHDTRDEAAALNNAEWCASVWRSHGLPVERAHGLWFCRRLVPQYYPNVISVDLTGDPKSQAAMIVEICDLSPDIEISVKDSFANLDLRRSGFERLFEGHWLFRPPDAPTHSTGGLQWHRIEDAQNLAAWESAWRGSDQSAQRIFLPNLLQDQRVIVLGGFDEEHVIRCGGIAYDAANVLGVTNIFGTTAEFIDVLRSMRPARAMVCYESERGLKSAEANDFQPLGPLRVWVRAFERAKKTSALP